MYPQLFNQAARYAPMLQRLMGRGASFATPLWKASQIEAPEVNATPMPPQGATPGPSVPISTSNYTPRTPYPQGTDPMTAGGPTSAPMYPMGTDPMTAGAQAVPMPMARPAEAPQADPMSFFQRNSAMMRDPMTGQFIDPTAGAQAQASGPDLISKMMNYLHNKA